MRSCAEFLRLAKLKLLRPSARDNHRRPSTVYRQVAAMNQSPTPIGDDKIADFAFWIAVSLLGFCIIMITLCVCSCAPYMDVKRGVVSAGFLSSTQGFSGKMKVPGGGEVTWSVTGTDAATGVNNLAQTVTTGVVGYGTAKYTFKTAQSNNSLSKVQTRQPTIQGAQKPTILKSTAPDGTVSESAVFPPQLPLPKK